MVCLTWRPHGSMARSRIAESAQVLVDRGRRVPLHSFEPIGQGARLRGEQAAKAETAAKSDVL